MNDKEKNALLSRELKTAMSWNELSDHAKQLVIEYRDRILTKLKNFFSLNPEEKEILHKLPDEVLTQIIENTPLQLQETLEQDITQTVEEIREPSEERKKEKEKEEIKQREELARVSPEAAILNAFAPEIYNYGLFFSETSGEHVDSSINAFSYLRAMGFTNGMWEIGSEHLSCVEEKGRDCCRPHKEVDPNQPVCQALWTRGFTLDWLIDNAYSFANQHTFYPPKAIIALSHPNCKCFISCWLPTNAESIPDSAPGLPVFADPEELLYYKEQVLVKMTSVSQDGVSIPVDRWTVLSTEIYGNTIRPEEESLRENYKTAPIDWNKPNASQAYLRYARATENWIEDIKPVIIRKGFLYKHALNFIRPIPDTYFGIQIERNDKERRVFLSDMNYIIKVPDRSIEEVKIKSIPSANPEPRNYIKVDDTYGIIISVLPDGRLYCYLPEFNEKIFVDNGTLYEIA